MSLSIQYSATMPKVAGLVPILFQPGDTTCCPCVLTTSVSRQLGLGLSRRTFLELKQPAHHSYTYTPSFEPLCLIFGGHHFIETRMRLINVKAFLGREELIKEGKPVDRRTRVLQSRDDLTTEYAILSHRWIEKEGETMEVNYDEVVALTKMERAEQDEVRQCDGYQKILRSCEQAKRDGYEWLWADTCCIDKQSSAELSEAINSMYRWYQNSTACYAYLHDVPDLSFPGWDEERYPNSNGWPEWFSRGWTLQEMIAPSNVEFFNKDWRHIGDKRTLASTLSQITQVPQPILTDGLSSNRPCVAQIMSWAAKRTTTRVEDRAYSLLGLLDVNMPMLYGEGQKAFHRLQLEIIRVSNDQSIFAWSEFSGRTGSILADDPSFFQGCSYMTLMDHNKFIQRLTSYIPKEELRLIDSEDRLGVFPVTNRGIQIWMFLRPLNDSGSIFQAFLPCGFGLFGRPVIITLALWKSNYYRYFMQGHGCSTKGPVRFHQVYLRYQDTPHCDATFEIDDSAITENGFTYYGAYPEEIKGNKFTLTDTAPLCVKVYSDNQTNCRLAVGFGQCFGQDWVHFIYENPIHEHSWKDYSRIEHDKMLVRGPEHARSMAEVCSQGGRHGRVWVKHTCPSESTRTVRISCVIWQNSRNHGVRIDAIQHPYNGPEQWMGFSVEGTDDPNCDMRNLMIPHIKNGPYHGSYTLLVDGISMSFSRAPNGIKLGDYGYFTDSEDFLCEGNVFADLRSLVLEPYITPRQHTVTQQFGYNTDSDNVTVIDSEPFGDWATLCKPLGLSLPSNHDFNSLLTSLGNRLTDRYLVIRVIQCANASSNERPASLRLWGGPFRRSSIVDPTTPLCIIRKPFVWHHDGADSASVERSGNGFRAEMEHGQNMAQHRDVIHMMAQRAYVPNAVE
ncbi:heterokaryon incompatibility protein-domain-containing protein [Scleroderma yunnanense]